MSGTQRPLTGHLDSDTETETAVLALHSAFRHRGIAAADGDLPLSVRAEHAGRQITVRLVDGHWWRPMPGEPHVTVPVAPAGIASVRPEPPAPESPIVASTLSPLASTSPWFSYVSWMMEVAASIRRRRTALSRTIRAWYSTLAAVGTTSTRKPM
jgi:hypothetical protein